MIYNLSNEFMRKQFDSKCELYKAKGNVVELKLRTKSKTYSQLKYLHVLLKYVGCECGCDEEYVKKHYYKLAANKETFIEDKYDKYLARKVYGLRSCASLTMDEMTLTIERFRNWASMKIGIYLPQPHEEDLLAAAEAEIERNKMYL